MPVPRPLRKVGPRVNPFIVPIARRVRPLAVVHHVGRRTGRAYQTPVMAFRTPDGWVVALIYGVDVQWLQNAQRSGEVAVTYAGARHQVREVRLLDTGAGGPLLPMWARAVIRPAKVHDYVLLVAAD